MLLQAARPGGLSLVVAARRRPSGLGARGRDQGIDHCMGELMGRREAEGVEPEPGLSGLEAGSPHPDLLAAVAAHQGHVGGQALGKQSRQRERVAPREPGPQVGCHGLGALGLEGLPPGGPEKALVVRLARGEELGEARALREVPQLGEESLQLMALALEITLGQGDPDPQLRRVREAQDDLEEELGRRVAAEQAPGSDHHRMALEERKSPASLFRVWGGLGALGLTREHEDQGEKLNAGIHHEDDLGSLSRLGQGQHPRVWPCRDQGQGPGLLGRLQESGLKAGIEVLEPGIARPSHRRGSAASGFL